MTTNEELAKGRVFGVWDAPMTDGDEPCDTPVGVQCVWCREPVQEGDNGRIAPVWLMTADNGALYQTGGHVEHRECSFRNVMGGIGHLVDHARYCKGELGTDAGLSMRQSSLLVWEFMHETGFFSGREATPEQLAQWRTRLEEMRGE